MLVLLSNISGTHTLDISEKLGHLLTYLFDFFSWLNHWFFSSVVSVSKKASQKYKTIADLLKVNVLTPTCGWVSFLRQMTPEMFSLESMRTPLFWISCSSNRFEVIFPSLSHIVSCPIISVSVTLFHRTHFHQIGFHTRQPAAHAHRKGYLAHSMNCKSSIFTLNISKSS